jgi:uncharacterized protein YndB with AHSA1/START domain
MTRSIKHEFFFAHPPEVVWDYLTKAELMEQWLMKNDFQPIVGLDFQFRTNPIPGLNFDGIFYCKVIEVMPYKKLSYSWNSGPGDGRITLESTVTWKLQRNEKGTDLFLDHSGFAKEENLNFYNGLMQGWLEKFQKITEMLNAEAHDKINA